MNTKVELTTIKTTSIFEFFDGVADLLTALSGPGRLALIANTMSREELRLLRMFGEIAVTFAVTETHKREH